MDQDTANGLAALVESLGTFVRFTDKDPILAELSLANLRDQANHMLKVAKSSLYRELR